MEADTSDNSTTIIFMVSGSINGLMVEYTRASGKTIRCMEQVSLPGGTDGDILVNMRKTKRQDPVYSSGQMAVDTKVIGKKVNSMVKEFLSRKLEAEKKVSGKMANELVGSGILRI